MVQNWVKNNCAGDNLRKKKAPVDYIHDEKFHYVHCRFLAGSLQIPCRYIAGSLQVTCRLLAGYLQVSRGCIICYNIVVARINYADVSINILHSNDVILSEYLI